MKYLTIILACAILTGCTTPATVLKSRTGQVVTCGGNVSSSLAGGVIGYHIQKHNDDKCVEMHKGQGFKEVVK